MEDTTPHNDFIAVPGVGNVGPNEYTEIMHRNAELLALCKEALILILSFGRVLNVRSELAVRLQAAITKSEGGAQ